MKMLKTPYDLISELQAEVSRIYPKPLSFVRPKDASTLIILRKNGNDIEMLMGKRHLSHAFMPGVYVFPGGKVDLADSKLVTESKIAKQTQDLLMFDMKGRASVARANAMALAAIRETFEETGYIIGQKTDKCPKTKSKTWQEFYQTGNIPYLDKCYYVARAITPPGGKLRYDTRFFAIWQDDIPNGLSRSGDGTDELSELLWVNINDVADINAPVITKTIIYELELRIKDDHFCHELPIPYYHYQHNKMHRDEIIVRH